MSWGHKDQGSEATLTVKAETALRHQVVWAALPRRSEDDEVDRIETLGVGSISITLGRDTLAPVPN